MSDNERIKLESNRLRGALAQEVDSGASSLSEDAVQLIKFHGSYQQDDRDERQSRKKAGEEKAYQFMVRARIPGGTLAAEQYLAFDDIAQRFGNGTLRLTTRQGIQLHGVIKRDLKPTIRAINDALLSTLAACGDVNRNVMACPAPTPRRADAQVQEWARRIAEHLAPKTRAYHEIWLDGEKVEGPEEEPIYGNTYLPRKFKIGVAHGGDNCVDVFTQDVGFIADVKGERLQGFTVVAGGGMGSTHGKSETYPRLATPICFIEPEEVLRVAEAIVTIHRDYGDRTNRKHARLKYVVEELGADWLRSEVERRVGCKLDDPRPTAFHEVDDHLGWRRESRGRWFLGLHVTAGRVVDSTQGLYRSALRNVIGEFRPGVRLTGQQSILLAGIPEESRGEIDRLFAAHGISTDPSSLGVKRYALACPALPTCGLAVAEAERALPDLVAELQGELDALGLEGEAPSVRMTGCPNGCARPRMGDIGIVGRSLDLYDIYVGGDAANTRMNEPFAQRIKRNELVATLRPALLRWQRERAGDETFGEFAFRAGLCYPERSRGSELGGSEHVLIH